MDRPDRAADAVVRALAAVGIVVPLLQNPRAAMLLAPDVKRLEPVGSSSSNSPANAVKML